MHFMLPFLAGILFTLACLLVVRYYTKPNLRYRFVHEGDPDETGKIRAYVSGAQYGQAGVYMTCNGSKPQTFADVMTMANKDIQEYQMLLNAGIKNIEGVGEVVIQVRKKNRSKLFDVERLVSAF